MDIVWLYMGERDQPAPKMEGHPRLVMECRHIHGDVLVLYGFKSHQQYTYSSHIANANLQHGTASISSKGLGAFSSWLDDWELPTPSLKESPGLPVGALNAGEFGLFARSSRGAVWDLPGFFGRKKVPWAFEGTA